jgi:hypothetical protein
MTPARQRRQFLAAVLAVLLVVLGVLARNASLDRYAPDGQSASRGERTLVVERAKELAIQAMSYDAADAATGVAKAEQNMTPAMRAEYERTLPSSTERRKQSGLDAKVIANVVRAGLVSLTKADASVLVFVNQRASAKSTKKVLESPTWVILHLVRQDSQWLLGGMEAP